MENALQALPGGAQYNIYSRKSTRFTLYYDCCRSGRRGLNGGKLGTSVACSLKHPQTFRLLSNYQVLSRIFNVAKDPHRQFADTAPSVEELRFAALDGGESTDENVPFGR